MSFYIFVNTDLDMSIGKTMAQVSHITQVVIDEIISNFYENCFGEMSEDYINYCEWKKYDRTIVLKANKEQIDNLLKMENIKYYKDDGVLTIVAFPPNDKYSFNDFEKY